MTVHWLTPFSSHHNVLSILPFVLLVETLSTGKMIPRLHRFRKPSTISPSSTTTSSTQLKQVSDYHPKLQSLAHQATSVLFFAMAAYAAIYGVTYAYVLHYIVNVISAWLMVVYYASGSESGLKGMARLLENRESLNSRSKEGRSGAERELKDASSGRKMDGVGNGKVEKKVP